MGQSGSMGQSASVGQSASLGRIYGAARRGLAVGQRCCGAALGGLCRGAAALLGLPGFPRAHALLLGALVGLGPLLRGRGDPHSVLASPHNRLEARLTSSAAAWTWLLIGSLLVASHPWLRPPWGRALRAAARMGVALALSRAGHALGHALEVATGSCRQATALGTLLLPLDEPAACRGAGHSWEGFGPAPQAFALVHCGLGLAEEAAALGRRLYGGKMAAAAGKMAAGEKMVSWYKMADEAKMAPWYKMAPWQKTADESKMAAGSKMAPWYKMASGSKMAAGYAMGDESKMASGSKMAAGYAMGDGSKMAAGSGWAWPRPTWRPGAGFEPRRPRPTSLEWAEPPHANYVTSEWAGPTGWSWAGGHLGRGGHAPFGGRGGHFDGGHVEGGHFEHPGGHFEGRHFEHPGGHFEGGHFEHPGGHFEGRHVEGRHVEGRHFDGRHVEPLHFDRPGRHFGGGHFDGGHFDGGHFDGGHLASPRAFPEADAALRSPERAPPVALSILYLLAVALLLTWHLLLVVTLTYRNTWARNAAGAALGWAAWAVTYRGWYRWPWSPGPPGWG